MSTILETEKLDQTGAEKRHEVVCQQLIDDFEKNKLGQNIDTIKYLDNMKLKFGNIFFEVTNDFKRSQIHKIDDYLTSLVSQMDQKIREGSVFTNMNHFFSEIEKENNKFDQTFLFTDAATRSHHWKLKTKKLVSWIFIIFRS